MDRTFAWKGFTVMPIHDLIMAKASNEVVLTPTISSLSPTTGPSSGGTSIVITGTNLTGTSSVTLNGIAMTGVTVNSSTSVTAITPASSGSNVTMVLTTPLGTATKLSAFTYVITSYAGMVISYTIGSPGNPGVGAVSGARGGVTTATFANFTLTGNSGEGGFYNNNVTAAGGTATGGTSNITGGTGKGSVGDSGGGGGGGIGGANATHEGNSNGDNGAQSLTVDTLFTVLAGLGQATSSFGAGSPAGTGGANNAGGNATGFGCGGGGGGYWGGNGGMGRFGGGGGGASGYGSTWQGGAGGYGSIVCHFVGAASPYVLLTTGTTYTVPASTTAVKLWVVGPGGGGSGATTNDGDSGGGGGAGGVAFKYFT